MSGALNRPYITQIQGIHWTVAEDVLCPKQWCTDIHTLYWGAHAWVAELGAAHKFGSAEAAAQAFLDRIGVALTFQPDLFAADAGRVPQRAGEDHG